MSASGGEAYLQHLLRGDIGMSMRIKTAPQMVEVVVTTIG
jgi:hypothetical protein